LWRRRRRRGRSISYGPSWRHGRTPRSARRRGPVAICSPRPRG
jgi:hypothetical protein